METLYRYFDAEGALLYVGITRRINRRMKEHSDHSDWFSLIAKCEFEHFDDRNSVLEAERRAIQLEKPLHNVRHNRRIGLTGDDAPEPGISTELITKGSWREGDSRHAITARMVQIRPLHAANCLHETLGIPAYVVKRAIENGQLGYIDIPNSRGTNFHRYVSGWQALDWLESLGANP